MKILSLDPAGNFLEGSGTTGWALSENGNIIEFGDIKANKFKTRGDYWLAHEDLILQHDPDVLVCESYRLFGHKSKQQIGSNLETPQLIGYLQMVAYKFNIPFVLQDPNTKQRHSDDVLVKTGILEKKGSKYYYKGQPTNLHMRDAIRHNLFYYKYGRKDV